MILHIKDNKCYLLIFRDNAVIINDQYKFKLKPKKMSRWKLNNEQTFQITFDGEDTGFFPLKQELTYYPSGKIILQDEENVYGILLKKADYSENNLEDDEI